MNQQASSSSSANIAVNDRKRLDTLHATGLLDSPPEEDFDRLTTLTCRLLGVPVALVSLVDRDRQFFKSHQGLSEPWASQRQTPLSHSFCQHIVNSGKPLIISDAREHSLTCSNPAVCDLGVVGYLGIPLITPDGYVIGSLCAITHEPRIWSDSDVSNLSDLAALVMKEIELRFQVDKLQAAEQALQQRTEELEQSNLELTQFTQIAAHDLGSPLHTLIGYADFLQMTQGNCLDEKGRERLAFISQSARRMNDLIQKLLVFASSGHKDLELAPINLSDLLQTTLDDLEGIVTENEAQIQSEPLPTVMGDETLLRLLFQNLLVNAIKYRRPSTPDVQITVKQAANFHQISVRDNGIGIKPQYLESIFEPFQRGHSRRQSGHGIGLATCHRIVTRHGGKIWVESIVDHGSTFHITLPVVD